MSYDAHITLLMPQGLQEAVDMSLTRDAALRRLMSLLLEAGFSRLRYYELDFHVPSATSKTLEDLAVLANQAQRDGERQPRAVGFSIPWPDTALYRLGGGTRVVVSDDASFRSSNPDTTWPMALEMHGRSFVDVPIVRNGEPRGLLAGDWVGSPRALLDADRGLLGLLGQAIGGLAESEDPTVEPMDLQGSEPDAIVQRACTTLMGRVDAMFGAVFKYHWTDGLLRKSSEFYVAKEGQEPHEIDIAEPNYRAGHEFLTGRAWSDDAVRYVADLPHLKAIRKQWVEGGSYSNHQDISGTEPKTVLYCQLGLSEHRYLLRFMNRRDNPVLPFMKRRRQILERLSRDLQIATDLAISRQRLSHLRNIAGAVVQNIHQPTQVIQLVEKAMADERSADYIFVATPLGLTEPSLTHFGGDVSRWAKRGGDTASAVRQLVELGMTSYAVEAATEKSKLSGESSAMHRTWIAADIGDSSDQRRFLLAHSLAGKTVGSMALAVDDTVDPSQLSPLMSGQIRAYCDLMTSSIEGHSSFISEDGARKALGYIGHEIGTPFTILGDSAVAVSIEALTTANAIQAIAPDVASRLRSSATRSYHRIQKSRDEIDRVMEIAPILASMGAGTMKMYLTPVDLATLVDVARERMSSETRNVQPVASGLKVAGRSRRFEIVAGDSLARLPIVAADEGLLLQALVNLLRNAVKYSLPRRPPEPMSVNVSGRVLDDGTVALTVENWGFGIPANMQSKVFLPFVRGHIEDRMKSLPGMGLGLYLVRTIISAHEGTVGCRSVPTLDDPRRTEAMEGWLTTFEIRLSARLTPGHRSIEIDPYRTPENRT